MSQGGRQEPGYGNGYGDDYAEDDDNYYTYDATDEEDEGRRRPLVMFAIFVLIFLFAGLVFLAYKQGLKQGAEGQPPIIRADSSPIKAAPTNPGGMDIPHQDRTVYDQLSGSGEQPTTAGDDTEHLLPKAEEPIAMAAPKTVPVEPAPVTTAPVAPVEQAAPIVPAPVIEAGPVIETPAPVASTGGGFVVQLASFRDEAAALVSFKKLQKKYPSLAGLSADVQKADLGEKGIYYRLRAGYMTKPDAQALCTELGASGQACFVRAK
ncbi:MAG: SPOR domain-containing protein [Parvibaculum sp.]|nr:SPOR domain-containing protein [Parvibaculum sp.]